MKLRFFCFLLLGILASVPRVFPAEGKKPEALIVKESKVVKAAYIYNFAKFIDWSSESSANSSTSANTAITICVVGSDPVGAALDEVKSLQAKGRPISVLHIEGQDKIPPCHILYISSSERQRLHRLLQQVSESETLTVSDLPDFAEQGGMIGFVSEPGRVLIEINVTRAQSAGLRISSKLLEIARILPRKTS